MRHNGSTIRTSLRHRGVRYVEKRNGTNLRDRVIYCPFSCIQLNIRDPYSRKIS